MIVVLRYGSDEADADRVRAAIESRGCTVQVLDGGPPYVLSIIGEPVAWNAVELEMLPSVARVLQVSTPYRLAAAMPGSKPTRVRVGDVVFGGDRVVVMAGPCAVESASQIEEIAAVIASQGIRIFRGGAYKPRTSPYSFQGLGAEGVKLLRRVADAHGLLVVSEVMDTVDIPLMEEHVDILQVGARNMQNYALLKALGRTRRPVLLKRGMSATIEEWLMSAEYLLAGGNADVILCERGIRTFEPSTRSTLDISAIPVLKELTHLPVVADPSHASGRRNKVAPLARAAVAAGADGILVEVHSHPPDALSDGPQSLYPEQLDLLLRELRIIAGAIGRML